MNNESTLSKKPTVNKKLLINTTCAIMLVATVSLLVAGSKLNETHTPTDIRGHWQEDGTDYCMEIGDKTYRESTFNIPAPYVYQDGILVTNTLYGASCLTDAKEKRDGRITFNINGEFHTMRRLPGMTTSEAASSPPESSTTQQWGNFFDWNSKPEHHAPIKDKYYLKSNVGTTISLTLYEDNQYTLTAIKKTVDSRSEANDYSERSKAEQSDNPTEEQPEQPARSEQPEPNISYQSDVSNATSVAYPSNEANALYAEDTSDVATAPNAPNASTEPNVPNEANTSELANAADMATSVSEEAIHSGTLQTARNSTADDNQATQGNKDESVIAEKPHISTATAELGFTPNGVYQQVDDKLYLFANSGESMETLQCTGDILYSHKISNTLAVTAIRRNSLDITGYTLNSTVTDQLSGVQYNFRDDTITIQLRSGGVIDGLYSIDAKGIVTIIPKLVTGEKDYMYLDAEDSLLYRYVFTKDSWMEFVQGDAQTNTQEDEASQRKG